MQKARFFAQAALVCLAIGGTAAIAGTTPLAPLFNGGFEIADPTAPRPQGWRIFNATRHRLTTDGLLPPAVTRNGIGSVLMPDATGNPNEFMGVFSEEFRDPNDPFSGRNWPEYIYNPPSGAPITAGFWFNIPASNPLSGQRFGLQLNFLRSGNDFSFYQNREWLDVDADAATPFPGCTIVTLPGGAKGIHTNGQWVQFSRTWNQSEFGSFPSPPTNPARASMQALRFGNPVAQGTVWIDDFTFTQGGCRADYNGDGVLTPADIFAFLNGYFAGAANADYNGDGVRTPADIFAFLNGYFARDGCTAP